MWMKPKLWFPPNSLKQDEMASRFVSIWFRYLATDWFTLRQPDLRMVPFVLKTVTHGRMIISSLNGVARQKGLHKGQVLADARAIIPGLTVMDDVPDLPGKLLRRLAEWCIRFTPIVAIDAPDGLLMDVSGCAHLWGGEEKYLQEIVKKLNDRGYSVRAAMADTPGVAWAVARYGTESVIVPEGRSIDAVQPLPPEALRLEPETIERLHKLGLHQVRQFISMPVTSLRRRFGRQMLEKINRALGTEIEMLEPVRLPEPYEEWFPCLEPVITAPAIAIALEELLNRLCAKLKKEQKGLRTAIFKGYRTDGKTIQLSIGTGRPSCHVSHLYKLFELKLATIDPGMGIELFILQASKVEHHLPQQGKMWQGGGGLHDLQLSELLDRIGGRVGEACIQRYLPDEHYWPERSFKPATSIDEATSGTWRTDRPRPVRILPQPERIEVTAPIPDYPPMVFRYKGNVHHIVRADGPERIEQEWWLSEGQHRDYYRVEDEEGYRYWLFRLGHYHDKTYQWFIHGFFA
jgi:protein ImuB